jgi:hypothetical protein
MNPARLDSALNQNKVKNEEIVQRQYKIESLNSIFFMHRLFLIRNLLLNTDQTGGGIILAEHKSIKNQTHNNKERCVCIFY